MGCQDVAFLPSRDSFFATFLKNCGKSLGTTTCLNTVVGCKQVHAPSKILLLQQILFCQLKFTVTKLR